MIGRIRVYFDQKYITKEPFFNGFYERYVKSPVGAILCLHRVAEHDSSRLHINEELKVAPDYLDYLIREYISRNIDIVSLDEIPERILTRNRTPFVCFTFDDGYRDNYQNAYPIFRKYGKPFNIYLTTSFPEQQAVIYWDILEDIILSHHQVVLNDGSIFDCSSSPLKEESFFQIRDRLFKIQPADFEEVFCELLGHYEFEIGDYVSRVALSWDEIRELHKSGLCTFGNHTHSHCSVTDIGVSQLVDDIQRCNELFNHHTGGELLHFSFPYGHYNMEVKKAIQDHFHFKTLTTLSRDYVSFRSDAFSLPRFSITDM